MKSILVIGAGFSAKVLIDYLSKQAKEKKLEYYCC